MMGWECKFSTYFSIVARRDPHMKKVNIGGQAILEGVMMKGPERYAIAVRKPDHEIAVDVKEYKSFGETHKGCNAPIIRGVVNFVESLYIGVKTLMQSAEYFEEEEEELPSAEAMTEKQTRKAEKRAEKARKQREKEKQQANDTGYLIGTLALSILIAVGVFMLLPAYLATFLGKVTDSQLLINLFEGVLRMLIFILYVVLISQMNDIKRTFMYHGAEHKTINCLEAGKELTPENVKKHTRYHKRCGTSFLFVVMIVSILLFMFIRTDTLWLRLLSRLLLVPVVAGISYEFIRYAGRSESKLANILSVPGMWVQRLTTKEPDTEMIEVAIKSVEAVIDWREYISCVQNDSFEK
jgi:uncharacterized protein YqhQ